MAGSPQSPAWIVTSRRSPPVRCLVYGLVPTGGCIVVDVGAIVPDRFALYSSFRSKRGRPCRVTTRDDNFIHFEYLPTKAEHERQRMARADGGQV
jgi:hypothetical protein